ncbi:non-muscle caldesmon-like isoform X2 [Acipenser ruthenus]|uniref:non-muscle caldesmon-like isoform X2 n=1 Tax=Acipenser ruthenus TaxID=7906 RepID=UPI00145B8CBC|nr:non-muscle caldesmon-like isoform X2 [Acipenser ruthenus]
MDDFERRRELRRQKREEMRIEAERLAFQRTDEDDEEAARERRRRARQDRLRNKEEEEETSNVSCDKVEINNQNSVAEEEQQSIAVSPPPPQTQDESSLQEKLDKREERRQKRLQEALERQKEFDPTISLPKANHREEEEEEEERRGRYQQEEEKTNQRNAWRDKEEEEKVEPAQEEEPEEPQEEPEVEEKQEEVIVEKPRRSYMTTEVVIEEKPKQFSRRDEEVIEDKPKRSYERAEEVIEEKPRSYKEEEVRVERKRREVEVISTPEPKHQNGGDFHEDTPDRHKKPERSLSRGGLRSIPDPVESEQDSDAARQEAEHKLEVLRRRRDETESEEFHRMKLKQQEAEQELEELKRKREERRKVLEEEEQLRKQEESQKKAREEEEKRRMKEEIERRRAEAAEKRQKITEEVSPDGEGKKPFKCVSPRGSSLKIGERAEFLNKSVQKSSSVKSSHPILQVSKIDNKLELYTSAVQTNKEIKHPKPGASDLSVVGEGVRNMKSMWEKGNVFSSPGSPGAPNKETAGLKVGVASRINDWLNKTPDSKTAGGKPADLKPGDVTNKRSLWENKPSSPDKSTTRAKVTAGGREKIRYQRIGTPTLRDV